MIYLIVGNSGSGKTTQAKLLEKLPDFHRIVTYTTRPMRPGEVNNIDYHFITLEEFNKLKNENKFLEVTEYAHNFYATPREELTHYASSCDNCILVVDLEGVKKIKKEFNAVCIYLKACTDSMIKRMQMRKEDCKVLDNRLKAHQDFSEYADYTINADEDINCIYKEIKKIIDETKKC